MNISMRDARGFWLDGNGRSTYQGATLLPPKKKTLIMVKKLITPPSWPKIEYHLLTYSSICVNLKSVLMRKLYVDLGDMAGFRYVDRL